MTIKISARYDGSLIRAGGSDRYLLFKLIAETEKAAVRAPLNLSLVLDRSGSMASEHKLELVKQAAAFVVERLSEQDRVNVVAYDDEIKIIAKSAKATPQNRRAAIVEIHRLITGGSTNLGEGWLTGCREVAEYQTEARYIDCAWLLTDGLANVGMVSQEELATHAGELRKRGISTTTFGVGLDFNEHLLRAMAEKGGGNFYFIDSSRQIKNYFEGELGERLNTVARNLALQIEFPDGVSLDNINDYEASRGSRRTILHLGDMYAGEERSVLVKVSTPAGTVGNHLLLNALLMFTDPLTGQGREVRLDDDLSLTYTTDQECDNQTISADMKEIIGRLLAARTRQEIVAANQRGDFAAVRQSTAVLQSATRAAGVDDIAEVQKELDAVEKLTEQAASAPLEEKLRKSTHYFSHNSQRSRRDYKKEEDEQ